MTSQNTLAALAALATGFKPNTQANLAAAQQLQTQNGDKINAQIEAQITPQPTNAPAPALTIKETATELRAFNGPFWGYTSFVTPKGKPFCFYNSNLVTQDVDVIEACGDIPGVVEVPYTRDIQLPPQRNQGHGRSATASIPGSSETTITPMELMTRAIGNSTHVPQAGDSTSTVPN